MDYWFERVPNEFLERKKRGYLHNPRFDTHKQTGADGFRFWYFYRWANNFTPEQVNREALVNG